MRDRADSSSSTQMAAQLVSEATEAFAQGDEDAGRRLVTRAARIYEQTGEPELAVELLVERGLADSAVVIAARTGQHDRAAQLLGTRIQPLSAPLPQQPVPTSGRVVAAQSLIPPLVEPPRRSPRAPTESEWVSRAETVVSEPPSGGLSSRNPANWVRARADFQRAYSFRIGRSPLLSDLDAWSEEIEAAHALGAEAYVAHLQAIVKSIDPQHPILDRDFYALEIDSEPAELVEPESIKKPDAPNRPDIEASPNPSVLEIDAAISSVVRVSDPEMPEPIDVGPILPPQPPASASEDLSGTVLRGRFRLEEKVGRGAQAQVYKAHDQVLDRELAVKILADRHVENPETLEGFLVEARLAAQVHHSGCLEIFDFGREGDLTFLAMEYFEGRSLRSLLKGGRLEPLLVLHIGQKLADALDAVHAMGIVHRDVKPSNVLVNRRARPKLMDFGVAMKVDAEHEEGTMVGTIRYMAPEQARGRPPHPRADIFSLGALLWEMIAGHPPFDSTVDSLKERMNRPPPVPPMSKDISADVVDIVVKCLFPSPEARPSGAGQVAQVFGKALTQLRRKRSLAATVQDLPKTK